MDTTQTGLLSDDELSAIDDSHNWQTTEGRMAAYRAVIAKLQSTQEHVQAGELPDERPPLGLRDQKVDELARVLHAAFAKAEPRHGITLYPESYWATFADMARAALSARKPLTIREIGACCGNFSDETVIAVRQAERAHGIGLEVHHG